MIVREPVDGSLAIPLPRNKTQVTQHAQLMGHAGLAHAHDFGEVADAQLLVGECEKQTHAGGIGHGAEDVGHARLCGR